MGHGGGGQLSSELIEYIFLPALGNDYLRSLRDSSILPPVQGRLAISTDSYVVRPLFFPGGCIGDRAVHGTVNDLAMSGARPLYMSAAFILEEGLSLETLHRIVERMSQAARRAGVSVVAGDTKVVQRGHGDGCFINTTGMGLAPDGINIGPERAQVGDAIILNGTIADHGMAIMSVREGLEFDADIASDTSPLHDIVSELLTACPEVRVLRDPTRGGIATSLNEIARASRVGIEIDELSVPIRPVVQSACDILGLDPWVVANEGKFIAIVPREKSQLALAAVRRCALGSDAAIIGHVVDTHVGMVVAKTGIGASRVVMQPVGEQLPRIC
jgi:hydrogenase expression/formation protein HypE